MSTRCPACEVEHDEGTLVCSRCGTLIWRDRLAELFRESRDAEAAREYEGSLKALAECATLLPPDTRQHAQIQSEIQRVGHLYSTQPRELNQASLVSPEIDGLQNASGGNFMRGAARSMGRGLTRPSTLISLAIWTACFSLLMGWQKALVFGLFIYVHEMGHLLAIQYYGYRFAWPVFVPFLGAFVLQGKHSEDRRQNIIIAAAGPLAGSIASGLVYIGVQLFPGSPQWLIEVTNLNLIINFVNLLPIWVLDGARIANQLTRRQLVAAAIALAVLAAANFNGFAFLMAAGWVVGTVAIWNTFALRHSRATTSQKIAGPYAMVILLLLVLAYTCKLVSPAAQ
ncbi:MAG: site-2 protease family protein [Candidatus Sumerlaeaceae bacterium]